MMREKGVTLRVSQRSSFRNQYQRDGAGTDEGCCVSLRNTICSRYALSLDFYMFGGEREAHLMYFIEVLGYSGLIMLASVAFIDYGDGTQRLVSTS